YKALHLGGVDFLDFLEQPKIIADLLGDLDEGAEVLGKATSAESERRIEKAASNAIVHAHTGGDLLDVGPRGLTEDGDGVDVGDFQGEERIGSMFDQLRGINVGHNYWSIKWRVNFLHGGHGPLRTDADDDAVRFQK